MNRKITFIAAAITFSIAGAANASLTLTDALGGSSAEAIAFRQWVLDNHKINDPLFDYSSASKATFVDSPTTNIGSSNQTAHNLLDSHNYDLQTFWIPQFESDEAEIAKQTVAQPDPNYADKHTGTPQYVVKTDATKPVYYGESHRPNTSATEVIGRNTTAAPSKTTTTNETDNSLDKQLNKRQIFILNSMAETARYEAQQFNIDNRNIAENHRRNTENSAAIRANAQRLDSVEQHQSSQDSRIDENKKQASAGVSAAFAQANIPQVTENQQFAVGAGVGGYDNENAIAVGASFHATSNSVVKLTVSDDSQDNVGYGAGVSVGW
uniref:YadA C-terminal domain-containing protein n=1 Tax=Hafnia alvei TaxID=569 RepID=UPI00243172E0|nr:YadA C-terminal domain-containing protein [Hafnia alvei]